MRKIYVLAVGLCLSVILPLNAYAKNGITENSDGSKTIIRSDNIRGDINLTIAGKDLEGQYWWGKNRPESTEEISGPAPSDFTSRDEFTEWFLENTNEQTEMIEYGPFYGLEYNNNWGGSGDVYENLYDDGNERYKRQGPCPDGWHVPSRGERNALAIAWCNLDEECHARYSDSEIGGIIGNLNGGFGNNDNKLISIKGSKYDFTKQRYVTYQEGLGTKFSNIFNIKLDGDYRSSSPESDEAAYSLSISNDIIFPHTSVFRTRKSNVRCFKDSPFKINLGGNNINTNTFINETNNNNINIQSTNTGTDTGKESNTNDNMSKINNNKTDNKTNNSTTVPSQVLTYKQRNQNNGNPKDILQNGYSREINNAYNFAYTNGLITTNNIDKAKMNSPLTRIAMAKMLSYYAINVLGKTPDTSKVKVFNDVTKKQNADYDNAVTLAYQLGIMGQGTNNFRPNDEVTRAEFATALSRMLYSTPDGKDNYYSTHLNKLKQEGIITNDNPRIKEKRGYVMLMLMRSVM